VNNTGKTTPPPDPEEEEAMREIAEEREEKYGGRDRWILTAAFALSTICGTYEILLKQLFALFFVAVAIVFGVLTFANWRSWLKKSPAEKIAPARSAQSLPLEEHLRRQQRSRTSGRLQFDSNRILDAVTLLSAPAFCVFFSGWNDFKPDVRLFIGVLILAVGAAFSFLPDDLVGGSQSRSKRSVRKIVPSPQADTVSPGRVPLLDYAVLLMFPVAVIAGLSYLIWMHHVLTQLQLALFNVAWPAAIFLVSYFVVRHEGYHVKKTGKPAPMRLGWTLVAFWVVAVFIFVVCAVNWIAKFGLKW
jgi:hypothetical protein